VCGCVAGSKQEGKKTTLPTAYLLSLSSADFAAMHAARPSFRTTDSRWREGGRVGGQRKKIIVHPLSGRLIRIFFFFFFFFFTLVVSFVWLIWATAERMTGWQVL
jgi:hypothetical protein